LVIIKTFIKFVPTNKQTIKTNDIKTQTNFRSNVFAKAHLIFSSTRISFSDALKKAWKLYRLSKQLFSKDEVKFSYKKVDGSLRTAYGTLKNVSQFIKGNGTPNNKVFNYWDLEAVGFRCFKIENIVSIG
jgi:hypothetical protein